MNELISGLYPSQWILLFYLYCLIGWIWEVSLHLVKEQKFVNRGFLYGPWLPIYGSGTMIIVIFTLPFSDNMFLVFLMGALSATVLEYVTGWAMERIFSMRWWDYTDMPLNIRGYICLPATIIWGVFSILMIRYLFPFTSDLIRQIPFSIAEILSILLTIVFVYDVIESTHAALRLKEMLRKIAENSAAVQMVREKIAESEERMAYDADQVREEISAYEERVFASMAKEQERQDNLHAEYEARMLEIRTKRDELADYVTASANQVLTRANERISLVTDPAERMRLETYRDELIKETKEFNARIRTSVFRSVKDMRESSSILRRNPDMVSANFEKSLSRIRQLFDRPKD